MTSIMRVMQLQVHTLTHASTLLLPAVTVAQYMYFKLVCMKEHVQWYMRMARNVKSLPLERTGAARAARRAVHRRTHRPT